MLSFACSLLKPLYLGFLLGCASNQVSGKIVEQPEAKIFASEVSTKHPTLSKTQILEWLSHAQFQPDIIERISRPYEVKPWYEYWPIFVTDKRAKEGAEFWNQNQAALAQAEAAYGVPPEIIIAIIGVETRYGRQTGNYSALDALATLAFGYPKRAAFFRKELESFLLLAQNEKWNPLDIKASYAGAIGQPQFMPSSYRNFAVDFDSDGKKDLLNSAADAIGSVAAYFKAHGWKNGEPIAFPVHLKTTDTASLSQKDLLPPKYTVTQLIQKGVQPDVFGIPESHKAALLELEETGSKAYWLGFKNFYVITQYNHSIHYAMAVYQLSQKINQLHHQKDL